MTSIIAQHSDFILVFEEISNATDGEYVDLDALSGIELVIYSDRLATSSVLRLNNNDHSGRFDVDNTEHNVTVQVNHADYSFVADRSYYYRLWLTGEDDRSYPTTLLTFKVEATVEPTRG